MRLPSPVPSAVTAHAALASNPSAELLLAVAEVGGELAAPGPLAESVVRGLRVLDRRLGAGRAVLHLVEPDRRTLHIRAAYGISAGQFRPRYGAGVAGRVAEFGNPIVVPNVRLDPMALSELADPRTWGDSPWSLVSVPVSLGGRRIGALSAYFRDRDPFGFAARVGALEVVASLVAQASTVKREDLSAEPAPTGDADASETPCDAVFEYANMIGSSVAMRQVYELVGQVARTNATALLRGESGTGKELVAHAIHHNSPRAGMPFVKVNCAALPEALFESELFGHERGAFTGALARKKGRFEVAQGGTLFLDEVGELSLTTQAKLLRVLQFREFERLGGTETLRTDVRVIAATNKDIERAVAKGEFREDLYYRMNIFTITLPPLRDRRADIQPLAEYFLGRFAAEHQRRAIRISSGAVDVLTQYAWPGNVRELENAIERAVVLCDGVVIQEHHLPAPLQAASQGAPAPRLTLAEAVMNLERQMVEEALGAAQGNVARAARALGTTERVLRYKTQKLGIDTARFRS